VLSADLGSGLSGLAALVMKSSTFEEIDANPARLKLVSLFK
jgi:hypothetical protein